MLFDFVLLIISVISILLCLKYKAEIEKLKKIPSDMKIRANLKESEEFTIELSKLTSEFAGSIVVDPLTNLPGREAFEDRLQQTINQSKRFEKSFALILMNIDEFHHINKAKGYDIGDKMLQEVAKRMQVIIRQIDTVTRYAGDTFAFLLPQLSLPETAAYVAQRILDNMALPFTVADQELSVDANLGVAIYPLDGSDIKTLLQNAANALSQAKEQGKGKYQFYHQELHALSQRELAVHAFLCSPELLTKISVGYQPYVNIVTGEVVCTHAAPSIQLADFGIVTFVEFVKIAENCKKIGEIGNWLLRASVMQFKKWHQEGFKPGRLAISVTLSQIKDPQFIHNTTQLLEEHQVKPGQIIFEIIDKNILSNVDFLEKSFSLLTHQGVQIAFSILTLGHFVLQKMTQLPISYLKIDSKLIQNNKLSQENEVIIHMLVSLARDMQIGIVAEGVNNEKQKELLQALGCEVMQGTLFEDRF